MTSNGTPLEPHLKILSQFFASATHHASAAMCQWTHGQVSLSLDEMRQINLCDLDANLEIGDDLLTMVILGIKGFDDSSLILAFDDENGRKLAASLLGREVNAVDAWSKLEESAIMETANILGSAYLNELTRLAGRELWPSPPYLTQDFGVSVLQQAIMAQAVTSDQVLICKTCFQFNNEKLNWSVFFVPGGELLDAMNSAIQTAT